MRPTNCWEHKKCGREPRGKNVADLGVCPAATMTAADGINRGKLGGRACWAIAGTFCGGKVQGSFANKVANCISCDFYALVRTQEGAKFKNAKAILDVLGATE